MRFGIHLTGLSTRGLRQRPRPKLPKCAIMLGCWGTGTDAAELEQLRDVFKADLVAGAYARPRGFHRTCTRPRSRPTRALRRLEAISQVCATRTAAPTTPLSYYFGHDRALFGLAIDSKLRGCASVNIRIDDTLADAEGTNAGRACRRAYREHHRGRTSWKVLRALVVARAPSPGRLCRLDPRVEPEGRLSPAGRERRPTPPRPCGRRRPARRSPRSRRPGRPRSRGRRAGSPGCARPKAASGPPRRVSPTA